MRCNMILLLMQTPLALALFKANSVFNGTIAFLRSICLKFSQHDYFCHMMSMVWTMTPLYSFGQDNWNEVQPDSLLMWCYWHQCWHHMKPMASPMVPLHSLGQDNWNKVQHDFWVMWCHCCRHQHHMMLITLSVTTLHSSHWHDQIEVQWLLGSCDTNGTKKGITWSDGIVNCTFLFLRSRQLKWCATWHWWHCQRHCYIP